VIIGDGYRLGRALIICTDSFTVEEVSRLMTVLYVRYDIDSTLQYHRGKPRIYIRTSSMPTLRNLVRPHMHPSFRTCRHNPKRVMPACPASIN
jgi:hypothetical protein